MRSSYSRRAAVALGVAAWLTILLFPSSSALADEPSCPHGQMQSVKTGVVEATGCWTSSGSTYTAAFADNPEGIDLNGFVLKGDSQSGIRINTDTGSVASIVLDSGNQGTAYLYSRNWPVPGQLSQIGGGGPISFTAKNGPVQLANAQIGVTYSAGTILALLASPAGSISTQVMLEPGGEGSMDLTVAAGGIFTLKGKAQSVKIDLPTKPEEGTKFDGFELKLQELDGIKFVQLYDLDLHYSISQKLLSGSANLGFPFFGKGTGVGVSLAIQNGVPTDIGVNVHGTRIPIGATGYITDLGGGFHVSGVVGLDFNGWCKSIGYESGMIVGSDKGPDAYTHWKCHKGSTNDGVDVGKACRWQTSNPASVASYTDPNNARSWICSLAPPSMATSFDLGANAQLTAQFGPDIPSPFGKIAPIRANARFDLAYQGGELVVGIHGGLELFRIPVGDAYVVLHSNTGVQFGAGLGVGVPSLTNNPNDPFYLGLRVDGWVARGKFQLEGKGQFSLFGAKLLAGDGLINDRGIGACWTVVGVPGGAFYTWGSAGPETFGFNSCRLGDYREQFPAGATASAARARTFRLTQAKTVLAVRGVGSAPRFTLRSAAGRVVRVPATGLSVIARDYAVFINRRTRTTYVMLPRARGTWTVSPYRGSATVASLKAARIEPEQRVTAKVLGTGTTRTLVYNALKLPNTRLLFLEVLPDGTQLPILNTTATSGRHRFRVETGSGYGLRELRVVAVQGAGATMSRVAARYRVNPPPILRATGVLDATRDGFTVYASWMPVRGASGYLVQVFTRRHGRMVATFVRRVSARKTTLLLPQYPALPGRSVATVWALNSDGKLGRPRSTSFLSSPSALTLKAAAKLSVRSAFARGGAVFVNTQCPVSMAHCQVRLGLVVSGRVVVRRSYQQSPGTFLKIRLLPGRPADRRALARALAGRSRRVRVTCRIFRLAAGNGAEAEATP